MKFYYAPHTCALASHIALEEAGAEYELVRVDFAANEQRAPAYMAINPKGRVPSLNAAWDSDRDPGDPDVRGALGDGRALHHRRPLSLHARPMA